MESALPQLNAHAREPLYQQLYTYFAKEIRAGRLAAGERLPSRRRLAAELHVALVTVDTAYGMLAAEGYLRAVPRSGYFVETLALSPATTMAPRPVATPSPAPPRESARWSFGTSGIDTSLFPLKTWRRLQRDVLADPALLNLGPRAGDETLRTAIAQYLHEYRGAQCTACQVVVGAGMEYLLGLLAQLFTGETFAVENPGYPRTHRILENCGARVCAVPVDVGGMAVDALEASGASLAYVTPSHQFPTGVTMPVGRRTALLRWASAAPGRWVIEDDYDSEFRFDGRPLPCLQGLDDAGRVVYISTFSRSVAPSIRIAYMVLPEALLPRFEAAFGSYSSTVSRAEQQTLCRFLADGHFARHLARMRTAYRARRDALCAALTAEFAPHAPFITGSHTGLHLVARLPDGPCEAQMVASAAAHGVHVNGLSAYYLTNANVCPPSCVVLGYAGIPQADIAPAAAALRAAWGDT